MDSLSPKTKECYQLWIDRWNQSGLEKSKFLDQLLSSGFSYSSVRAAYYALKRHNNDEILFDIKEVKYSKYLSLSDIPSPHVVEDFLSLLDGYRQLIAILIVDHGFRQFEVRNIKLHNLFNASSLILIPRNRERKERIIKLSKRSRSLITPVENKSKTLGRIFNIDHSELCLFPTKHSSREPVDASSINKHFNKVGKLVGANKISFLTLRNYYIFQKLKNNGIGQADLNTLSRLLGYSSLHFLTPFKKIVDLTSY